VNGIEIRVRPRARSDAIVCVPGRPPAVSVTEPAEGGKANDAVIRLIARAAGVRRCEVSILKGASGRTKTVAVAGMDAARLAARLAAGT